MRFRRPRHSVVFAWALASFAGSSADAESPQLEHQRSAMVRDQIERRGVKDPRVLKALREVPRHLFVPKAQARFAYEDRPLPIGHEQTISQPYIVALMTELLKPEQNHRILEIGTGSGYQAAVLSRLVKEVYSIEIVEPLGLRAKETLAELGYRNVSVTIGDGYQGLKAKAPFDGIIVTAAPPRVPQPLIDQLKIGGRMVIPVGEHHQELKVLRKTKDGIQTEKILDVRFVPMTGEAQASPD